MHMRCARLGLGVTIAAAVTLGACGDDSPSAARGDARVGVREIHRERADGAVYPEGVIQFVELAARGQPGPAVKLELELGGKPVVRTVEHGEYLVSSYTRTCESACTAQLDPPTGRCAMRLSIAPGERKALRVVTIPGRRCRIQADR